MPGAHTPRPAPLPERLLATLCSPSTRKKIKKLKKKSPACFFLLELSKPCVCPHSACRCYLSVHACSSQAGPCIQRLETGTKVVLSHLHSAEASAQLTGRSTSNLGDSRILQERHAAGNAFPKAGIPQLTLCSLASPLSLQAACSSQLVHLVLFHPHCPQFTRFSCLLCPLIPDRLKSKTRQRFIK